MVAAMKLVSLLLLSAVVASAAARGGAIPLLACSETRLLALCSPGSRLSTFCTCRLGLAFLFQLCLADGEGGGGGRVGGRVDDVHANATVVFSFFFTLF